MVDKVFRDTLTYLNSPTEIPELKAKVERREKIADKIQMEMTVFLGKVMEARLTSEETNRIKAILKMADEFESISDYCASIVNYAQRAFHEQFKFDEDTKAEIENLSVSCSELYWDISENIEKYEQLDMETLSVRWQGINEMADHMKETHLERASSGVFPPIQSLTLSDIVVALRRIKNHSVNLAEAYQGGKQLQPSK